MMIILVGGIKGGCGKTTIATHLAIYSATQGYETLLVDADDQQSAVDFTSVRNDLHKDLPNYTAISLFGENVMSEVNKMKEKFDHIIIDTGGRDTSSQRAALAVADKVLIPFLPRTYDIWTVSKVVKLVNEMQMFNPRLQLYAFLNKADSVGADNKDAEDFIKGEGHFIYLDNTIVNRKVYANSSACGLSVMEYMPEDRKARSEFISFAEEIFKDAAGKQNNQRKGILCTNIKKSKDFKGANKNKASPELGEIRHISVKPRARKAKLA